MTPLASNTEPPERVPALPHTHPLADFYKQAGLTLPDIERIPGAEVPEPYRALLVHDDDMTPTLQRFHGRKIHIRVLSRHQRDGFYFREVVLLLDGSGAPVEFGAIKINLNLFAPEPRRLIEEERLPLGQILEDHQVPHVSKPSAFLRLRSDAFINRALNLEGSPLLFGRRNTLVDPQQRSLAEIVEILPPTAPQQPSLSH